MKLSILSCAIALAACTAADSPWAGQITVGFVGPLSGLDATQGRAYLAGLQMHLQAVNKAGGMHGHTFQVVSRDDLGQPELTVQMVRELAVAPGTTVLSGIAGSANLGALTASGLLDAGKIPVVGYRGTPPQPNHPLLWNVRASRSTEIEKIARHAATIGIKRLALVHPEGDGADELVREVNQRVVATGGTLVARASYPTGTNRLAPAVATMLRESPQTILLMTSGAAAAAFIEQYRAGGGTAQLFAHSLVDVEQLTKRLSEEQMQGVAIAQVVPNPYKVRSLLTREFRAGLPQGDGGDGKVGYAMMEGFIAAKVIVAASRRAGGRTTRAAMATALDSLDNLDLGGYGIAYKGNDRDGSRHVDLTIISQTGGIRQ